MERVFSCGRLLLPHVRNALSPESTRAVLCLGQWSALGLIHDDDLEEVARLPEVVGDESDDEEAGPGSEDHRASGKDTD